MDPRDWSAIREAVFVRDQHRCRNCRRPKDEVRRLDPHHIVSRGQGGSNRMSNLATLCRRCHQAAHGEVMAPRVKMYSNGRMSGDEFSEYRRLWSELDLARFDGDEDCWYIPVADVDHVIEAVAS